MPGSDLDRQLQALACEAQRYPPRDPRRQRALGRLVSLVQRSRRLCRPALSTVDRSHPAYDDIYAEACHELWAWVCDRIDDYDPERSPVIRWLNVYLERRFFREAAERVLDLKHPRAYSAPTDEDPGDDRLWETLAAPTLDEADCIDECVRQYLETADSPLLEDTIRDCPEGTLRAIALMKLADRTLGEIAEAVGSNYSTVNSFYRRRKETLYAELRTYCAR